MRLIFGIVLGIALTFGAAFVHDNNLPDGNVSPSLTERQIVNWDVLGAVVRQQTAFVRSIWDNLTGG